VKALDDKHFHKIYGSRRSRVAYRKTDLLDYTLMTLLCVLVIGAAYGTNSVMTYLGVALCVALNLMFPLRHGFAIGKSVVLRRPLEVLYMFLYKLRNMQPMLFVAVAIFALDNFLIAKTPDWPHQTELMGTIALYLFFIHFIGVSLFRTVVLFSHLRNTPLIRDVLMQTSWKTLVATNPSISLHLVHACFTGLLTHLILIAPWYFIITHAQFSVLTLAAVFVLNVVTHYHYMKGYNAWFYRDHWLAHNSELEFLYLHGTHHDAIPSALIGVSGNGHLEGFLRHTLGNPMPLYNPILAFLLYTLEVVQDMRMHQYIPGVFPRLSRRDHETSQHSTHHYGHLEPYSIGLKLPLPTQSKAVEFPPREILNSIALDEQLTGFKWDNHRHRQFMKLFDQYQGDSREQGPDAQPVERRA
jgi:hypothetical protein